MLDGLVSLGSGVVGAAVGALVAWRLATNAEHNRLRRDTLVKAAEALQDFRIAYALWYVEFLSPEAQASGSWAKPPTGKPDPTYLALMRAADAGRGQLRIVKLMLRAYFPRKAIAPLFHAVDEVLVSSGTARQADCRDIDRLAEAACDLIPDLMEKYS